MVYWVDFKGIFKLVLYKIESIELLLKIYRYR